MRVVLLLAVMMSLSVSAQAIPGRLAAGKVLVPSFKELHRQYLRIVLHESGWRSKADQNGILKSLLFDSGGRIGDFDHARMMQRMLAHSGRTFPRRSRFLTMLVPSRRRVLEKTRTYHSEWVSAVQLSCAEPVGWDRERSGSWSGYRDRCKGLVDTTRAFLRGEMTDHCKGQPTTWGSEDDVRRRNGAMQQGWREIMCDWPAESIMVDGQPVDGCVELREMARKRRSARRALLNSDVCARNRFFDWRETERSAELTMR